MKKCKQCGIEKDESEFYRRSDLQATSRECKECHKDNMRIRRESMREELAAKQKEYRKRKPEVCKIAADNWKQKNKEKLLQYYRDYYKKTIDHQRKIRRSRAKERRKSDSSYKLRYSITRRILLALKTKGISKNCSAIVYLGCSIQDLKSWLESKFTPRMNWKNHGEYWHIDHIIPCAAFDLSDHNQALSCFHYRNLQPLPAKQNISKADKITHPQMSLRI
jgi:hypothetical protein